jgi:hypothetical protein
VEISSSHNIQNWQTSTPKVPVHVNRERLWQRDLPYWQGEQNATGLAMGGVVSSSLGRASSPKTRRGRAMSYFYGRYTRQFEAACFTR